MKKYLICSLLILSAAFAKAQSTDTPAKADTSIYTQVAISGSFPGGMRDFYNYVVSNLKYPESAKKDGVQGKVFLNFVIEKDGTLTNFHIMRSLTPETDAEAIRVLKASPKWTPAQKDNVVVRQRFVVPISFSLQ